MSPPTSTTSSPGPPIPSQSLIKRSSSSDALSMPPPPPKRIKRPAKVLDEDEYTDALSHIIARDFFPGLLETQSQKEYLDALESRDKDWIRRAGRNLEAALTPGRREGGRTPAARTRFSRSGSATPMPSKPGETPKGWGGDTPMSMISSTSTSYSQITKDSVDVANMSLSSFQAKYTSEDNESFNKVLDKQNIKKREKYAWMWSGNKIPTPRQIAYRKREQARIAATGEQNKEMQLITTDSDARPAKPDSWKSKPENPLMFIPSSIEDSLETVTQKAESTSRAGPKQVIYSNTRVQPSHNPTDSEQSVPPSPSLSAIRDAIAGRPRPTDSEPGYTGGETPRVNGYAFVDEDEPEPDEESAYHLSLLASSTQTTGDGTPNPFTIRENRKRELLHHRMVERVAKGKRAERVSKDIKTPVPKFPSSPMIAFGRTPGAGGRTPGGLTPGGGGLSKASLTPAAQRLWAKVGSTPSRGMVGVSSSSTGLKNMWTPTPGRTLRKGK
ncbi:hypothetical protein FQN55_002944 [Onygenales sp. PD_40]|nr:hypothetical protein FQN55_002944 [Onygenales sp. PD_40]